MFLRRSLPSLRGLRIETLQRIHHRPHTEPLADSPLGGCSKHPSLAGVIEQALPLGHQPAFKIDEWMMFGVLNAIVAVALFHFLDKLRESA